MPLLSVIVPVYNEINTIGQILEKINSVDLDKEIIVVDDGSDDATAAALGGIKYNNLKIIHHTTNRGKGAAVLTGLANAGGEFIIIQDADLEYDPGEYIKLMQEIKKGGIDIVLGVRFTEKYHGLLIPRLGNRFLSGLLNFLFGVKLNDFLTCYKLLRKDTMDKLGLKSQGFAIDTEIAVKAIKKKLSIRQVPIAYKPRSYREGKKIRIIDGLMIMSKIIKYRLLD